ncbi:related to Promoter of filamentation protein 1 [Zygosaccharomyces bailii ISA1307]|nr:related to Promoter of filamentation protein 1 [Zygosaccharomyces bailii ISA1307]
MTSFKTKSCLAVYHAFCEQKLSFQVIYGAREVTSPKGLLVLDSSFNPPHSAHYNLVKRAIKHYNTQPLHVILLLSVNNADKAPKPATFEKRMEMMCIMADILEKENISASVGITTYGKFVNKDKVLRRDFFKGGLVSYLVGFDTIIRVLNPKYYLPQSVPDALGEFMESTNFFCLTRKSDQELEKQIHYRSNISDGLYEPTIPRDWGQKIQIELNDDRYCAISSSHIREMVLKGSPAEALEGQLPLPILKYVMEEGKQLFL